MFNILNIIALVGVGLTIFFLARCPILKKNLDRPRTDRIIILKLNTIMANIQELKAQVAQLQADLDTEQQQVADALAALNQAIAELQAMVADGGTPQERQELADALTAISEDLKGTIPDA